jgi:DNA-3-methyladenine glycosylase II
MQLSIAAKQPYSFAQTVAFLRRFPPCQGDYVITDDSITAAVSVRGTAHAFTLRAGNQLTIDLPRQVDTATQQALKARAADFIGAGDDLTAFYAAAADDPPVRELVARLYGLHHVRFLTLEEIAVYCVFMQRTPVELASVYKRRFLDRFGIPIEVVGATLRAMPELDQLVELDEPAIAAAIGHKRKAAIVVGVVRGVAAIGEAFLRTAPYAAARDALLEIPGIGPFSAAAILLRGLGRMDELPGMRRFEDEARTLYGRAYDATAIARRYGAHIGYWAFYLKTGVARIMEHTPTIELRAGTEASARRRIAGPQARP